MSEEQASDSLFRVSAAFAGWACVGALFFFGAVSLLLPILAVCVLAAGALAYILLWRAREQWVGLFGSGVGVALVVAYIGWLNRNGPGTVCVFDRSGGSSCTDEAAPWPYFVVATVLTGASIGLCVIFRRIYKARRDAAL